MKIKFLLLIPICLTFSCSPAKKEIKCSTELLMNLQTQLFTHYLDWKTSLNYMDKGVVGNAYQKIDRTITNLPACFYLPETFLLYADSVSRLYTKDRIQQNDLTIADALIQQLDSLITPSDQ